MGFREIEWTDEVIEEFWRYWSERPDTYFSESLGGTIARFAAKHLGEIGTVLDFGAGSGGLLAALSNQNEQCYGLDFGRDAIDRLTGRFAGSRNVVAIFGADRIAEFRETFDTVFLIETLEHLPERHLMPSLQNILSMLKPGGWLVASTPNDENLAAAEVYCPVSKLAFHPMQHVRSWDRNTLANLLAQADFNEIDCLELDLQALAFHSKSEALKRVLKRVLYRNYKDPHLIAFARKPGGQGTAKSGPA